MKKIILLSSLFILFLSFCAKDDVESTSCNCSETPISYQHELYPDSMNIIAPNIFSPNQDGLNDIFQIFHNGTNQVVFEIFDEDDKIFDSSIDGSYFGLSGLSNTSKCKEYKVILNVVFNDGSIYNAEHKIVSFNHNGEGECPIESNKCKFEDVLINGYPNTGETALSECF